MTIGEGEEISPNTQFEKTWRIRNTGAMQWPLNTVLSRTRACTPDAGSPSSRAQGDDLAAPGYVPAPSLLPGEETDVSVPMVAPNEPGGYSASWRLGYMNGAMPVMFGDEIWVC